MLLEEIILENVDKTRTVFDLAAICYQYLIDQLEVEKTNQEIFIGTYIFDNTKSVQNNPNRKKLNKCSVQVEKQLLKNDGDENHEAQSFERCVRGICSVVRKTEGILQDYEDNTLNRATVAMYILYAIDRYLGITNQMWSMRFPQNKIYSDRLYIYLSSSHNILDDAAEELEFPKTIESLLIKNQLSNLTIVEQHELGGFAAPSLIRLWISPYDEVRNHLWKTKKIKIAVVPFEKEHMVEFPMKNGSVFQVNYTQWHTEHAVEHALQLLDLAMQGDTNIVIFPEYVCSKEVQEAIGNHLQEKYEKSPKQMKSLLFVVAGSGWIEGNNIACIYSYNGKLLGRQYKKVKFNKVDKDRENYLEGLENPGKESFLCEVNGIGKFMFAICRDVSDRSNTRSLAETFRPQFLLVPAWSPSVHNGFEQQFCEIAAQNHRTCSLICNCCEAFGTHGEQRTEKGLIVTPYKDNTTIRGMARYIKRNEKCWKDGACGGCFYRVIFNFQTPEVREGKIIQRITHKRLSNLPKAACK